MKDQVFMLPLGNDTSWKVALNNRVVPAEWNSKGAAIAGLAVERRRDEAKKVRTQEQANARRS